MGASWVCEMRRQSVRHRVLVDGGGKWGNGEMGEPTYHHVSRLALIIERLQVPRYKQREIQGYPPDPALCMANSSRGYWR